MTANEATFEARLGALLATLFPASGIQVAHQVQFSLRLGHHDISIDGRKGWEKKGRLDVLLTAEAGHVAVLELKRDGLDLTDADRDQGLSYARLLTPMPPLVLVSNGTTTKFFTTLDGAPWTAQGITEGIFAKLVSGAAASAAHDRDQAIRSLLGADPSIWADFLRAYTADALVKRTGELRDFGSPFARGFSVGRFVGSRILGKLRKKAPLVALVGPPLSGKSVALKQCAEKMSAGNLVPLYVDASSAKHGPLRLLASIFLKHLFAATNIDQVRQWLSTSLRAMPADTRLVLLLDEVVPDLSDAWLSDLDELLGIGEMSPLSIVVALDPNTLRALSVRPGRPTKTELGRRADVVHLDLLDEKEFSSAMSLLFDVTRGEPYFGAQYNIEYREPRVLRVIAATLERHGAPDDDIMLKFPSTTTINEVELAWRAFVRGDHELLGDLRALARAYLQDLQSRSGNAELQLASQRAAAMRRDVAEKLLPAATLTRLIGRSFLSTRLGPNEEVLLLPRHLELFGRAAALELADLICSVPTFREAYDSLMGLSDLLPLGDIVGADALRAVARTKPELFSQIVHEALREPPRDEVLPAGTVMAVSLFGKPSGSFETPEPSTLTGNIHPWLVLAQFAVLPLEGDPERVSPNAWIIANVGSYSGFLRRVADARWREMQGFHFHDVPGKGSVPCLKNGVVEPLGQAIIAAFHFRPEEMVSMAEYAIAEDRFHLAWRLNTVAREMSSATDAPVAEAADQVAALTDEYFRLHYGQLLHEAVPVKGEEVTTLLHGRHDEGESAGATDEHRSESEISRPGEPLSASKQPGS